MNKMGKNTLHVNLDRTHLLATSYEIPQTLGPPKKFWVTSKWQAKTA